MRGLQNSARTIIGDGLGGVIPDRSRKERGHQSCSGRRLSPKQVAINSQAKGWGDITLDLFGGRKKVDCNIQRDTLSRGKGT